MLAGGSGAPGTRDTGVPASPRRGKAFSWAGDGFWVGVGAVSFALGAFLLVRLHALPPNEDEVLAFFISHGSLGEVLETVLGERGGAPLHYLLAYLVGQVDPGLTSLRLISVAFAVGSVPVAAAVVARLSDRRTALLASCRRRGELDDSLPRHLRRGCTASSSSRARSRFCSSSARWSGARAAAGRPGRRRRSRSSPRSPTACSSSARRLRTSQCSAFGGRCPCARR